MFLGLSPLELVVLAGLALALFGPDKLPGAVREGARILRQIKSVGEDARADLLEQLGPEITELDPRRLHPRNLMRETMSEMLDPLRSVRDDVRRDLRDLQDAAPSDEHAHRLAAVEAQPFAAAASTSVIEDAEMSAASPASHDASSDVVRDASGGEPADCAVGHVGVGGVGAQTSVG